MLDKVVTFQAQTRENTGKGPARRLREDGKIPCVLYGMKKNTIILTLDEKALHQEFKKGGFTSRIFALEADGKKEKQHVLPKAVQLHPVTDMIEHVDFLRVNKDSHVSIFVKVHFLNKDKSPGLKRGGVLNIIRRRIELMCKADSIPENIEVDLSGMQIGDSIHISSISLPEGTAPTISDRDFTIAAIVGRVAKTEDDDESGVSTLEEEEEETVDEKQ